MAYLGTQPNDVKKNTGLYTPSEILQLTKDGSWGGSLELIEEQTASGVSSVDFNSIKENVYDVHLLSVSDMQNSAGSNSSVLVRFYESGVLETASVYQYAFQYGGAGGSFGEVKSTGVAQIQATIGLSTTSNSATNFYSYFYNLGNSSKYSFVTFQEGGFDGGSTFYTQFGGGVLPQTSTVDGIRLISASGTLSGNYKLYGVKQI
jgi:hypothetical protein